MALNVSSFAWLHNVNIFTLGVNTIIFLVIERNLSHLKNHFAVENLGQHSLNQGIEINRATDKSQESQRWLSHGPQWYPGPDPWNLWLCYLTKRTLQIQLRWGDYSGLSRWAQCNHESLWEWGKKDLPMEEGKVLWWRKHRLEWYGHQPRNGGSL